MPVKSALAVPNPSPPPPRLLPDTSLAHDLSVLPAGCNSTTSRRSSPGKCAGKELDKNSHRIRGSHAVMCLSIRVPPSKANCAAPDFDLCWPDVRFVKHQAPERLQEFARPRKNFREQRRRRLARSADGAARSRCEFQGGTRLHRARQGEGARRGSHFTASSPASRSSNLSATNSSRCSARKTPR